MENRYYLMSETVKKLLFEGESPRDECFYYVNTCPLCESKKLKQLFKQWGISYKKCKECGFVFSNPRLNGKGAFLWYNSKYYNLAMQKEHFLSKGHNPYISVSLNDVLFGKIIQFIEKSKFGLDAKIVDVGCGSGAILHYLKDKLGFTNLTGFDLNSSNIEFARKYRDIDIKNIDVYDLDDSTIYDLIITTENIEHISNIKEYLVQLAKLAKEGTCLLLSTPHNDKVATKLMRKFGDHFCAPNHQNYFNFENISNLLRENKFSIKQHWIYDSSQFNIFHFLKSFFKKQDQIAALPNFDAFLGPIYKWQKDHNYFVSLKERDVDIDPTIQLITSQSSNNVGGIKKKIKNILNKLVPIHFKTHQIILARYDG